MLIDSLFENFPRKKASIRQDGDEFVITIQGEKSIRFTDKGRALAWAKGRGLDMQKLVKETEFNGYWKGTDKGTPGKKMVGATEATEFKNSYNVGDKVNTPMGTATIVVVSKNINVDGKVKVKLDDPNRAGPDGETTDTFVLKTTDLSHIKTNEAVKEKQDNFTPDDIKELSRMTNINDAKQFAIELISRNNGNPMKPEKINWFKKAVAGKRSVIDVVKLMYDLMLSGEGIGVIGSKASMAPNSYRKTFGEDDNQTDTITMDVPLFIRMLEYAKEDAQSDMDLHNLTERAIRLMQQHDYLCMDTYDDLVGQKESTKEGRFDEPLSGWRITAKNGESVIGPKFNSKDEAQKYLMTELFRMHHEYKIVYYGE